MFVWLDRNTFKLEGKLHILNFCNVALIGLYDCYVNDGTNYTIKAKFNDGSFYVGGTYAKYEDAEKEITKFFNARPPEYPQKPKIKIT